MRKSKFSETLIVSTLNRSGDRWAGQSVDGLPNPSVLGELVPSGGHVIGAEYVRLAIIPGMHGAHGLRHGGDIRLVSGHPMHGGQKLHPER